MGGQLTPIPEIPTPRKPGGQDEGDDSKSITIFLFAVIISAFLAGWIAACRRCIRDSKREELDDDISIPPAWDEWPPGFFRVSLDELDSERHPRGGRARHYVGERSRIFMPEVSSIRSASPPRAPGNSIASSETSESDLDLDNPPSYPDEELELPDSTTA
ncbi:hypothetical protein H072_3916 [Dactylellina haptotyla CBS 200.50]|uniref:Uncharacterized protein n=1 Tax=Dactylellina haptotyla (strain CBS 200.50) TaxID=1284197 RepID=S8C369_DACHA|nr:hypothetical protein H072_3916 [Dactylellina haptotyla CBS 200.50]